MYKISIENHIFEFETIAISVDYCYLSVPVLPPTVGGRKLNFTALPLGVIDLDGAEELLDGVSGRRVAVLLHHVTDVVLSGLLQ